MSFSACGGLLRRLIPLAGVAALLAVAILGISAPSAHPIPPGSQTALMILELTPAGGIEIGWAEPKPVLWSGGHREATLEERSAPVGPSLSTRPERVTVVVEHPKLGPALAVDIELPHETGGDVVSAWTVGSMMVRVPFVGYGTQYVVVRSTEFGLVRLAEWVVER